MKYPIVQRIRAELTSREVVFVARIAIGAIAVLSIHDALTLIRVISVYEIQVGTMMWLGAVLEIVTALIAVVFVLLILIGWKWSVWAWALVLSAVAIGSVLLGLNSAFLFRWETVVPWLILAAVSPLNTRFAAPWRSDA